MALTPAQASNPDSRANIGQEEQLPSYTWYFDLKEKVLSGTCDGKTAVMQSIYLTLFTDRYKWLIHDWDYGHELASLFGMPLTYVIPEIERLVKEALIQDDRIDDVFNFHFEQGNDRVSLFVSFDVKTNIDNDVIHIDKFEVVV